MELRLPAASLGSGRRNRFACVLLWGPQRWLRLRDVATSRNRHDFWRNRRDFWSKVRILLLTVLSMLHCGHSAPTKWAGRCIWLSLLFSVLPSPLESSDTLRLPFHFVYRKDITFKAKHHLNQACMNHIPPLLLESKVAENYISQVPLLVVTSLRKA